MRDSAVLKGVGASEGLSLFCNGCKGGEVRCNGRGKPAPLRKARGIVRFWEGWCRARDGVIFHCVGFNSNRFIDRLKPPLRVCNGGFVYRGYFRKPSIIFSSASSLVRPSEQSFNICSPAILPIAAS